MLAAGAVRAAQEGWPCALAPRRETLPAAAQYRALAPRRYRSANIWYRLVRYLVQVSFYVTDLDHKSALYALQWYWSVAQKQTRTKKSPAYAKNCPTCTKNLLTYTREITNTYHWR